MINRENNQQINRQLNKLRVAALRNMLTEMCSIYVQLLLGSSSRFFFLTLSLRPFLLCSLLLLWSFIRFICVCANQTLLPLSWFHLIISHLISDKSGPIHLKGLGEVMVACCQFGEIRWAAPTLSGLSKGRCHIPCTSTSQCLCRRLPQKCYSQQVLL